MDEAAAFEEGLASLKAEVAEDSPLSQVIYASYYEENGLIVDALTSIEQAIKMNPDVGARWKHYETPLPFHSLHKLCVPFRFQLQMFIALSEETSVS